MELIATGANVFITGRAGTGKSTFLQHLRSTSARPLAVLAPTGDAAVNVRGQTIHSFFGFRPDITPRAAAQHHPRNPAVLKALEVLVIDEISMVRSDLLDSVDAVLRVHGPKPGEPFGGVQLVLIGDLYQLPPVVTQMDRERLSEDTRGPYFFQAQSLAGVELAFLELERIFRQRDSRFIELLNAIRTRTATPADLAALNARVQPDFDPPERELYVTLTTTNDLADAVNAVRVGKLPGKSQVFGATVMGEVGSESHPTAPRLELKKGAQVMMLTNDSQGRWVNGTMARVKRLPPPDAAFPALTLELEDGRIEEVEQHTWEIIRYAVHDGAFRGDVVGSFTQFPLRLAFAITIHKSQGKTFERVILDLGRGAFAHGQLYVALSRCTTLEGLVLRVPIRQTDLKLDQEVVRYVTHAQYATAARYCPRDEIRSRLLEAIADECRVEIVYLKAGDEKTRRVIRPQKLGMMRHEGRLFEGVEAWCELRDATRVFALARILDAQSP